MARRSVSNAELAHIFRERLLAFDDASDGTALAIVPDEKFGWSAVFPRGHRPGRRRPFRQERVDRIQNELRRLCRLNTN